MTVEIKKYPKFWKVHHANFFMICVFWTDRGNVEVDLVGVILWILLYREHLKFDSVRGQKAFLLFFRFIVFVEI